jgi:succinate dehydrogenase / fumarate reductase flavoprotein subunit/NADH-dependent fumarate reductase subunit A
MQEFDVVVIGGGASGLRAAVAAKRAGASVALISKTHPLRSNSGLAQGGINAPLGKDDSPETFTEDTLAAGDGLSERSVVQSFAQEAAKEVLWLEQMGVPFNRDKDGRIDRRRFGSNSRSRSCYTDDRTGHIVLNVLYEQFQRLEIPAFEEWFVTSLAVEGDTCVGAIALGLRSGKLDSFAARAVVLATGGLTRMYLPSTVSIGTTGDGQALAYLCGAHLMDMEMVQFHPTVFPKGQGLLITEATLGSGAQIVNQQGVAIQVEKDAPRSKLCLAISQAAHNGDGSAFLDLKPIGKEKILASFPQTHELLRSVAGLDCTKDLVPIHPVAHRPMGGVEATATGQTSIAGLFAVGECACNGLNGAGRLAGNTLTEAVVFGKKVGDAAALYAKSAAKKNFPAAKLADEEKRIAALTSGESSQDSLDKLHADLGRLMNEKVGLVRDAGGLQQALEGIKSLRERHQKMKVRNAGKIYNYALTTYLEVGSMLTLAEVIARSAQARTESRGAHYRKDFPAADNANWKSHTIAKLSQGSVQIQKTPVAN